MNSDDRKAIEDLFGKLKAAEENMPQREAEADAFINDQIKAQPGAPYYMAQTIVVQEHALASANARIAELERQVTAAREEPRRGGLFSGLFGGGAPSRPAQPVHNARSPWGQGGAQQQPMQPMAPARGGGFLAGAAQTAVGVAGGVLLGNAVAGMFGGNEAEAAPPAEPEAPAEDMGFEDTGADEGGFFDGFGDEW